MNALLTSVGRRAYMVKYFQEALAGTGEVHVCNSDDLTVAFQYADKSVISPLIYDDNYIPFLLNYCKENSIDILLSLFDIDLLMLAKHKKEFEEIGTKVIVSDEEFVSICNDKWKTYLFLKENGFNVPRTYLSIGEAMGAIDAGILKYPIIVKPRFGCGSIAMSVAEDEMSLLYYFSRNTRAVKRTYLKYESETVDDKIIFQEFLHGQEYGVDCINDLNGNFVSAFVKRKLAMRAGETDIAETVDCPEIYETAKKISGLSKHIANVDMDVFLVDGKPYVLEMNARFGGGYPFSHVAGCNLPKAIVEWCKGREPDTDNLTVQTGVRTYKELVLTKTEGKNICKS
ncbi:MAG: ATP-grasp domain-containing protein [Clostridia bacterium]|nr:ATP-grasp domain-containing protein [Clostridia bacterium]